MFKLLFLIATILYAVYSQDIGSKLCAWNRAKPVSGLNTNLATTLNFINGEFIRDNTYVPTQTQLYRGVPYYKMTMAKCYVLQLWLYRHLNYTPFPPKNTWVIAISVGAPPELGYAYCTAASADQDTPNGACDGKWMVGDPGVADHAIDPYFKVMVGGCPQVTCDSLTFSSTYKTLWAYDYNSGDNVYQSVFTAVPNSPNVYLFTETVPANEQTSANIGKWYLFWNPKAWRWAVHDLLGESTYEYDNCDRYRDTSGFKFVSDIKEGDYSKSVDYAKGYWFLSAEQNRTVNCTGTMPTPQPTPQGPAVPTLPAPQPGDSDFCNVSWGPVSPSFQQFLENNCGGGATPAPFSILTFTNYPSPSPSTSPTATTNVPSTSPSVTTTSPSVTTTSPSELPSTSPTELPSTSPTETTTSPSLNTGSPTVYPRSPSVFPTEIPTEATLSVNQSGAERYNGLTTFVIMYSIIILIQFY